jgi:hypothetical protein
MHALIFLSSFLFGACLGPESHTPSYGPGYSPMGKYVFMSKVPIGQRDKPFGIYFWRKDPGCDYPCGLRKEIELLGDIPDFVLFFTDLKRPVPHTVLSTNRRFDIKTVLTQDLRIYYEKGDPAILDSIIAGKWDEYFLTLAGELAGYGNYVIYRFGYEMNGDWFPWGQQPEKFKSAWRRVWVLFQEAGAVQVKWLFSPNVLYGKLTPAEGLFNYYPGDAFVDIVGADGYNFGNTKAYHSWRTYEQIFGETLNALAQQYPHKPLWISEIGCAPTGETPSENKIEWLSSFLFQYNRDLHINNFIWFNEDKRHAQETNWRIDSDDDTLIRFREWLGMFSE